MKRLSKVYTPKVGDEVKVYGHHPKTVGGNDFMYTMVGRICTVNEITDENEIIVTSDDHYTFEVHPNQCRLIKKYKGCSKCGK